MQFQCVQNFFCLSVDKSLCSFTSFEVFWWYLAGLYTRSRLYVCSNGSSPLYLVYLPWTIFKWETLRYTRLYRYYDNIWQCYIVSCQDNGKKICYKTASKVLISETVCNTSHLIMLAKFSSFVCEKSNVRNPKSVLTVQPWKVMSTCPQLILELMAEILKLF